MVSCGSAASFHPPLGSQQSGTCPDCWLAAAWCALAFHLVLSMSVPASPAVAGATTPGVGSPSSAASSPSPPPTADGQTQPPPRKRSMVMGTSVPTSFALGSFVPIQEANWSVLEAFCVSTRSSLSCPCNRALLQFAASISHWLRGSQATAVFAGWRCLVRRSVQQRDE